MSLFSIGNELSYHIVTTYITKLNYDVTTRRAKETISNTIDFQIDDINCGFVDAHHARSGSLPNVRLRVCNRAYIQDINCATFVYDRRAIGWLIDHVASTTRGLGVYRLGTNGKTVLGDQSTFYYHTRFIKIAGDFILMTKTIWIAFFLG